MGHQAIFDGVLVPKILDQEQAGDNKREGDSQPRKRSRSTVVVIVGH